MALGVTLLLSVACATEPIAESPSPSSSTTADSPNSVAPRGAAQPPTGAARDRAKNLAELAEQAEARAGAVESEAARSGPILGADMSWPQCPRGMGLPQKRTKGAPLPTAPAEYVVVGLTNGPGFVVNPCLADQVDWVRQRGLQIAAYAVASFPDDVALATHGDDGPFDGDTRLGSLRNTGYQQARYNIASMRRTGLVSPVLWIDVEPVPDFEWSADPEANAAVVQGLARGYTDAGLRIGVYSTAHLWQGVVGGLRLGVPEWRAAGQTSGAEALARCGQDSQIQGGRAVLGQWVEDDRDQNLTCPGIAAEMDRWFHQY